MNEDVLRRLETGIPNTGLNTGIIYLLKVSNTSLDRSWILVSIPIDTCWIPVSRRLDTGIDTGIDTSINTGIKTSWYRYWIRINTYQDVLKVMYQYVSIRIDTWYQYHLILVSRLVLYTYWQGIKTYQDLLILVLNTSIDTSCERYQYPVSDWYWYVSIPVSICLDTWYWYLFQYPF